MAQFQGWEEEGRRLMSIVLRLTLFLVSTKFTTEFTIRLSIIFAFIVEAFVKK